MIYADLQDAKRYLGIHPRLDHALGLLTEAYLRAVPAVRREIDGSALFVTRFDVHTSADETRLFEYHRRYLDIFAVVEGVEQVDITAPGTLALEKHQDDYWGGRGEAEQTVILRPGKFLVLFPGDAHRPGTACREAGAVSRIVFKILTEEK